MPTSWANLARRENARRSTGPKTEAGKAQSRINSVKHGLAGAGVVLPPEIQALVDERRARLGAAVNRHDHHTNRVEQEAVLASIRLDAARLALRRRVAEQWDNDRDLAALQLACDLGVRPEEISLRLDQTSHGVAWKLARWTELAQALDDRGTWTPEEAGLALDLLGVARTMRPATDEPIDRDACKDLVIQEQARLNALKTDVLDPTDESERLEAMLGVPHDDSPAARLYRRYEHEHWRKYETLSQELMLVVRSGALPPAYKDPKALDPVDAVWASMGLLKPSMSAPAPTATTALPSPAPKPAAAATTTAATSPAGPSPSREEMLSRSAAFREAERLMSALRDEAGAYGQGLEGSRGRPTTTEGPTPRTRRGRPDI